MATIKPQIWLMQILNYSFKAVGYVVGITAILVASLLLVLHSPAGGQRVATVINSLQSHFYISRIELKNGALYVPDFRLQDSQGQWLRARHIYLAPDYNKLLAGTVALKPSFIRELSIDRAPAYPRNESDKKAPRGDKSIDLSNLMPAIDIAQFDINYLYLAKPLLPANKQFHLQFKSHINPQDLAQSFINLSLKEQQQEALNLVLNSDKTQLIMSGNFGEDLGHIFTKSNTPISANLTGNFQQKDWQGQLTVEAKNLWQIKQDMRISPHENMGVIGLQTNGFLNINNNDITINYKINLHANIKNNSLLIKRAFAQIDDLKIDSDGHINFADNSLNINTNLTGDLSGLSTLEKCTTCSLEQANLKATISGYLNNPRLYVNGKVKGLVYNQARLADTDITVDMPTLKTISQGTAHLRTQVAIAPQANQPNDTDNFAITGPVQARLKSGVITLNSQLSGVGTNFKANATYPLPTAKKSQPKLQGSLNGQLDLTPILALIPTPQFRAGGIIHMNAALAGTATDPELTGDFNLTKGSFEDLLYGTKLKNITANARWQDNRLNINDLSLDGGRGSLSGAGHLTLKTTQDIAYTLNLSAKQMRLIDSGSISAISSGELSLTGTQKEADLSGDITIHRARLYLMQLPIGSQGFTDYEIINTNSPRPDTQEKAQKELPFDLSLNLSVESTGNIIARAQGFESDWGARLKITGKGHAPELNGLLFLRRGELEIASLMVELTRGDIRFYGDPSNPSLDIRGTIDGQGTDATLIIGGQAKVPTFRLTSESNLPEEELLSQVLFGENAANLSPFQAIQIAQVIAALQGKGGGFNPLAELRRKTGLDTLSVNYDDAGGSSLEAGKYISDKVYIGIEQGTVPGSSAVSGEIEINDRLSIETSIGGASQDTKAGLKWRWDY